MCKLKGTFSILTHPSRIYVPFYVQKKVGIWFRYLPTFWAKVPFLTLFFPRSSLTWIGLVLMTPKTCDNHRQREHISLGTKLVISFNRGKTNAIALE